MISHRDSSDKIRRAGFGPYRIHYDENTHFCWGPGRAQVGPIGLEIPAPFTRRHGRAVQDGTARFEFTNLYNNGHPYSHKPKSVHSVECNKL
jgi:hypothetical protein